jgi:hypothetical protein
MSKVLNSTTAEKSVDIEQLNSYDRIAALVAENKKVAEIYIKKGATGMLIFDFFWGFIKAFLYMFIALFKGAAADGGRGDTGAIFRFFRAIFDTMAFPIVYTFRVSTIKNQKKQAEEIVASDSLALQEIQNYFASTQDIEKVNLREKVEQIVANNEILKSFDKPKK